MRSRSFNPRNAHGVNSCYSQSTSRVEYSKWLERCLNGVRWCFQLFLWKIVLKSMTKVGKVESGNRVVVGIGGWKSVF
jgi:hypothetical protein